MKLETVELTDLSELLIHIKMEVKRRSMPERQKAKMVNFISKIATDAYALGRNGKVTVEKSE